ncbi:hypothetical protein TCAL_15201 [Tigriopus californicus]|uniref:Uncharacterized protein n=1 Tax=Tigriopus californicus TaxID=6832 RepID=A0A553NBQ0_TIGCA|nr:hypothetical protein TCAL_15201 [Tigriopus californicus]
MASQPNCPSSQPEEDKTGQLLYVLDDKTLVLSDASGHGNIISGFAPDILQQALAEVTANPVSTSTSSSTTRGSASESEASRADLDGRALEAHIDGLGGSLHLHLPDKEAEDQGLGKVTLTQQNALLLEELANVAAVDTNTAAASAVAQCGVTVPNVRPEDVVTVLRAHDGTLEISPANAKALGLSVSPGRNSVSVQAVGGHGPFTANTTAPSSCSRVSSAKPVGTNMILIPTTATDGTVNFVLKPSPAPRSSPVTVTTTSHLSLASPHHRPSIIGRRAPGMSHHASIQLKTSSPPYSPRLRPVMTPSVMTSVGVSARRSQPMILPKPQPQMIRLGSNAFVLPRNSNLVSRKNGLGTHLVSEGIKFLPPGSSFNTTAISACSGMEFTSSVPSPQNQSVKITSSQETKRSETKVVFDPKTNTNVIYKVVYPEDVGLVDLPRNPPVRLKDTVAGIDSSDDGDSSDDLLTPNLRENNENHVPSKAQVIRKKLNNSRKRGRPRRGEMKLEKPEAHAKKLRKEFGLSVQQIQTLGNEIVSDRNMHYEMPTIEGDTPLGQATQEDDEAKVASSISMTRSGRVSKPPVAKDEIQPLKKPSVKISNPEGEQQPRPKRRFFVPDRYRCRVCDKIYLGDKKMAKHIKLYPDHGPKDTVYAPRHSVTPSEPPTMGGVSSHSLLVSSHHVVGKYPGKKMPEFSMPIIPMARTQLEELVKNLDAELVLDVMFEDMEKMLSEVKKIVDRCLIDTKLCDRDMPFVNFGECMQTALNVHEGPWYLEQPKHIPDEFHRLLGIQHPMMVSPRSDSTNPTLGNADDDNSNSLMSFSSDKDHSLGAQVVLEQNLGARNLHLDDDSQDSTGEHSKKAFDDHKSPGSVSHGDDDSNMSIAHAKKTTLHANRSNMESRPDHGTKCSDSAARQLAIEIDALSSFDGPSNNSVSTSTNAISSTATASRTTTKLPSFSSFMSGNNSPKDSHLTVMASAVPQGLISSQEVVSSPVPLLDDDQEQLANAIQAVFSSTNTQGSLMDPAQDDQHHHHHQQQQQLKSHVNSPFQSGPASVSSHHMSSVMSNPGTPLVERRHSVDIIQGQSSLHHSVQNSPAPSLGGPHTPVSQTGHLMTGTEVVSTASVPATVPTGLDFCGPLNLDEIHLDDHPIDYHPQSADVPELSVSNGQHMNSQNSLTDATPTSFSDHHSNHTHHNHQSDIMEHLSHQNPTRVESAGIESPSVSHFSNPPSVASAHQLDSHLTPMVSAPPSVASHHGPLSVASHHGPLSVASHHGPPSVASIHDNHHLEHQPMSMLDLPHSPYLDHRQVHSVPPSCSHVSGPPSVDMRMISNPASISDHHPLNNGSMPNSPLSEVLSEAEQFHTNAISQSNSRRNSVSSGINVGTVSSTEALYSANASSCANSAANESFQFNPELNVSTTLDIPIANASNNPSVSTATTATQYVCSSSEHIVDMDPNGHEIPLIEPKPTQGEDTNLYINSNSKSDKLDPQASLPSESSLFESNEVCSTASLLEPQLTNTSIANPGLKSDTMVVFTSDKVSSQKAADDLLNTSSSSSNHNFLSELESVFNDNSNFSFSSALNTESDNMKAADKFLESIPPSSIMVNKPPTTAENDIFSAVPSSSHFLSSVHEDANSNPSFPVSSVSGDDPNCVGSATDSLSKLFDEMTHPESKSMDCSSRANEANSFLQDAP